MPAAAVTAAITTGGGLIKGAMGMSAANKAGKLAAAAGQQANQVATDVYNTSKENFNPYIQTGQNAQGALSAMLGIGGDQKAQQDAFNRYLGSTNYQFQLGQGINAVKNAGAASFNSGATAKALNNYAQGQAGTALGGYQSMLGGLAGQGLSAAGTLGGIGTNYSQQYAGNLFGATGARINALNEGTQAAQGMVGSVTSGLTGLTDTGAFKQGISSFFNPNANLGSSFSSGSPVVPHS